jgi:hypothetical protein
MGIHAGSKGVLLKYPLVFWMACVGICLWPCAGGSQQPTHMGSFGFVVCFCFQLSAGEIADIFLGYLGLSKVMG